MLCCTCTPNIRKASMLALANPASSLNVTNPGWFIRTEKKKEKKKKTLWAVACMQEKYLESDLAIGESNR